MKAPLEPSPTQVSEAISQSRLYWHTLLARSSFNNRLPHSCNNLNALLHNTPAIPNASEIDDICEAGSLYLKGFSVWGTGTTRCDIKGQRKVSQTSKVILGLRQPQYCQVTNNLCPAGVEDQSKNFLFALVLGWCYVLSARHVELRGVSSEDGVFYAEDQAPQITDEDFITNQSRIIPIDSTDPAECRWWAAILTHGCRWRAVLNRANGIFHAPWSCHLNNKEHFQLRYNCFTDDSPPLSPPSAAQAQEYLINFAERHDAYDQLIPAFAASLTIPSPGRFGAAVCLPTLIGPPPQIRKTRFFSTPIPSADQLPHFMALSCIPNILTSSVFGCLWEREVECNLVSEWLGPLLQECIPSLLKGDRYQTIIHMMALRRPNSAPLWLGMWITGLIPRIFDLAAKIVPSISLEATHWTASSQSFMDPTFYGVPQIEKGTGSDCFIRREDEFRLLFLLDVSSHYPSPPICPWAPFDAVGIETCGPEIQEHVRCGHRPIYQCWTWLGGDGKRKEDHGLTAPPPTLLRPICQAFLAGLDTLLGSFNGRVTIQIDSVPDESIHDITLSNVATRNAFTWTLSDGTKPEDAEYWKHEWLNGLLDGFEDDAQDISSSEGHEHGSDEELDEFSRARTRTWVEVTCEDNDL